MYNKDWESVGEKYYAFLLHIIIEQRHMKIENSHWLEILKNRSTTYSCLNLSAILSGPIS